MTTTFDFVLDMVILHLDIILFTNYLAKAKDRQLIVSDVILIATSRYKALESAGPLFGSSNSPSPSLNKWEISICQKLLKTF